MKDFLRRTLESARGAEPRLRPLTGSVYAGNRRRQEFQTGSWGEDTDSFQRGVQAGPGATPSFPQLSQPGNTPAAWSSAPETLLPMRPDTHESAAGSLENNSEGQRPSSVVSSPVNSSSEPQDLESAIRLASHSGALQAPVPPPTPLRSGNYPLLPSSQRNEGSRAEATVPQVPEGISRAEKNRQEPLPASSAVQQRAEPLLRPAVAAKPPGAGPQLSVARNRPPQEPEIQVHIGRIEVIAATPQSPRVPSPRPNRATSLSDYLAGRNGRS